MDEKVIRVKIREMMETVTGESLDFPKYTTQLINLANQNSGGTRPKIVGQLSELIQECPHKGFIEWSEWYIDQHPDGIDNATRMIMHMIGNLKEAIELIDEDMVRAWVKDLVVVKTFIGLNVQEGILKTLSEIKNTTYRLANSSEESRGIDGYIGENPVSIKPLSYKTKNMLSETIDVNIIYYNKEKDRIDIFLNEDMRGFLL